MGRPTKTFSDKLKTIQKGLAASDFSMKLTELKENLPSKIDALQNIGFDIQNTALEGIPFQISLLQSNLCSDQEIAETLNISIKAVKKYKRIPGYDTLLGQMSCAIWSDLRLLAQARIAKTLELDDSSVELAKWVLEATGDVQSSRPVTVNQTRNQTLVMNQGNNPNNPGNGMIPVDQIAESFYEVMNRTKSVTPPPRTLSH